MVCNLPLIDGQSPGGRSFVKPLALACPSLSCSFTALAKSRRAHCTGTSVEPWGAAPTLRVVPVRVWVSITVTD